jgi:Predicted metal-dependent protease of the PAD1/JAB1 superfamily
MRIYIAGRDADELVAHAKKCLPNEACGLIGGEITDSGRIVREVVPLTNVDASAEHFSMDAKEQFAAVKEIRARGHRLIANFHSHPNTPARPSEEDLRLALDPSLIYFIISLSDEIPVLKAFSVREGVPDEVLICPVQ